ncbi:MAG: hypothetical protein EBS53_05710 [Bacteroidetes bacterium]|nr:hypothetical protein [Bacteroidota bacterium]
MNGSSVLIEGKTLRILLTKKKGDANVEFGTQSVLKGKKILGIFPIRGTTLEDGRLTTTYSEGRLFLYNDKNEVVCEGLVFQVLYPNLEGSGTIPAFVLRPQTVIDWNKSSCKIYDTDTSADRLIEFQVIYE